jgi:hypothetical protein
MASCSRGSPACRQAGALALHAHLSAHLSTPFARAALILQLILLDQLLSATPLRVCVCVCAHTPSCRSAPLPLKVDGFSMGAVLGYSEQHTLLLLTTQEEVDAFLNVSCWAACVKRTGGLRTAAAHVYSCAFC